MTTVTKKANNLWEIKRGEITVGVNMRLITDKFGPAILVNMHDRPLGQLKPDHIKDLRLALQATERLLKKEKHRWSPQSEKPSS